VTEGDDRLIERVANRFILEWVKGIDGIETYRDGGVAATAHPVRSEVGFLNTIRFLRRDTLAALPAAVEWYARRGVRPWIETYEDLSVELGEAGYAEVHRSTGFRAAADDLAPSVPAGVVIEEVGEDAIAIFGRTLSAGHDIPPEWIERATLDVAHWPRIEGCRTYLAYVDGTPAAAAALRMEREIAYLANASTVPASRGRGCQAALIARRITDATAAGARTIVALARTGSGSARNMERAGLRPAVDATLWRLSAG
jgi:hypothetical protein